MVSKPSTSDPNGPVLPKGVTGLSSRRPLVRNPEIIKVSASALRSFEECPYRYALDHVSRLPDAERSPVPIFAFGNAVHQTLAKFVQSGGRSTIDRDGITATLMDCWDSSAYPDPETELAYFHRAKEMVERFHESPYPQTAVEDLGIEQNLAWIIPHRNMLATGRVDRLIRHPDGTTEILDYKTSRTPLSEGDLLKDAQTILYRSLVADRYPELASGSIRVTFYYLPVGKSVSVTFDRDSFLEAWQRIEKLVGRIREGRERARRGWAIKEAFHANRGNHCRSCPMRGHCDGLPEHQAVDVQVAVESYS
jgi:DNA helicase-2/ATP-dependent DNA helicase PcrA